MYNITANTVFTGKSQVFLPTCHSTNEYAQSLVEQQAPEEGSLIITPNQTKGKGQFGASWEAEKGKNLTFSLIMYPFFLPLHQQFYLSIITALAVRKTLFLFLKRPITVKWPNDIYLNDSKMAGILLQTTVRSDKFSSAIIGVGINVNQVVFSDKKAVSMANVIGEEFSLEVLLSSFLEHFECYYLLLKTNALRRLMDEYHSFLYRIDVSALYNIKGEEVSGILRGVNERGELLVEIANTMKTFDLKEISFIL